MDHNEPRRFKRPFAPDDDWMTTSNTMTVTDHLPRLLPSSTVEELRAEAACRGLDPDTLPTDRDALLELLLVGSILLTETNAWHQLQALKKQIEQEEAQLRMQHERLKRMQKNPTEAKPSVADKNKKNHEQRTLKKQKISDDPVVKDAVVDLTDDTSVEEQTEVSVPEATASSTNPTGTSDVTDRATSTSASTTPVKSLASPKPQENTLEQCRTSSRTPTGKTKKVFEQRQGGENSAKSGKISSQISEKSQIRTSATLCVYKNGVPVQEPVFTEAGSVQCPVCGQLVCNVSEVSPIVAAHVPTALYFCGSMTLTSSLHRNKKFSISALKNLTDHVKVKAGHHALQCPLAAFVKPPGLSEEDPIGFYAFRDILYKSCVTYVIGSATMKEPSRVEEFKALKETRLTSQQLRDHLLGISKIACTYLDSLRKNGLLSAVTTRLNSFQSAITDPKLSDELEVLLPKYHAVQWWNVLLCIFFGNVQTLVRLPPDIVHLVRRNIGVVFESSHVPSMAMQSPAKLSASKKRVQIDMQREAEKVERTKSVKQRAKLDATTWDATKQFEDCIINPSPKNTTPNGSNLQGFTVWCAIGSGSVRPLLRKFETTWARLEQAEARARYMFYWKNRWKLPPHALEQAAVTEFKDKNGKCKSYTYRRGSYIWTVGITTDVTFRGMLNKTMQRAPYDDGLPLKGSDARTGVVSL